jgi:hypothetical protein
MEVIIIEFRTHLGHRCNLHTERFKLEFRMQELKDRGCYNFVIL